MQPNDVVLSLLFIGAFWLGGCDPEPKISVDESATQEIPTIQFLEKAVGKVVPSANAHQLKQQGEGIVFVSVREGAEWDEYHIPGAISIPHSRLKEQDEYSWKLLEGIVNLSQIWLRLRVEPGTRSLKNNELLPSELSVQRSIFVKLTIP